MHDHGHWHYFKLILNAGESPYRQHIRKYPPSGLHFPHCSHQNLDFLDVRTQMSMKNLSESLDTAFGNELIPVRLGDELDTNGIFENTWAGLLGW